MLHPLTYAAAPHWWHGPGPPLQARSPALAVFLPAGFSIPGDGPVSFDMLLRHVARVELIVYLLTESLCVLSVVPYRSKHVLSTRENTRTTLTNVIFDVQCRNSCDDDDEMNSVARQQSDHTSETVQTELHVCHVVDTHAGA